MILIIYITDGNDAEEDDKKGWEFFLYNKHKIFAILYCFIIRALCNDYIHGT